MTDEEIDLVEWHLQYGLKLAVAAVAQKQGKLPSEVIREVLDMDQIFLDAVRESIGSERFGDIDEAYLNEGYHFGKQIPNRM